MKINVDDFVALATIPCKHAHTDRTEFHRIGVRTGGQLVFFDHPAMGTEIELYKLAAQGGMPHTCSVVLKQWASTDLYSLPVPLQIAKKSLEAIRKEVLRTRRTRRCHAHREDGYSSSCATCTNDPMRLPLWARVGERIQRTGAAVAKRVTRWKKPTLGEHEVVIRAGKHHCTKCGYQLRHRIEDSEGTRVSPCCNAKTTTNVNTVRVAQDREWDAEAKAYSKEVTVFLHLSPSWFVNVYQRGITIVDGYFVLDAERADDHKGERYRLQLLRPGRGYDVASRIAWYRPDDETLRWT